jgi:hypothetical protein
VRLGEVAKNIPLSPFKGIAVKLSEVNVLIIRQIVKLIICM